MNYDTILEQIGEFGPWQLQIALFLWLAGVVDGIQILMFSLTGISPSRYRCQISQCQNDDGTFFPEDELKYHPPNERGEPDFCKYYSVVSEKGTCDFQNLQFLTSDIVECEESHVFYYEKFEMETSVVTDFNLVCGRDVLIPLVNSFFMVGVLIGSLIFGVLSDLYGRRHILLLSIICASVGSLIGALMPNYWLYAMARILAGAGAEGCYLIAYTLSMEIVGSKEKVPFIPWAKYKTLLANLFSVPTAVGEAIISLSGYLLKRWRTLQILMSAVCLACSLNWFFIPESPRWLICNGKWSETKELLRTAEKKNHVKLSDSFLELFDKKDTGPSDTTSNDALEEEICDEEQLQDSVYSIKDLFDPRMRVITISLFVCWPVVTMVYYGISYSSEKIHLTHDVFLSYVLISLIEMPSYIFLILVLDLCGRKPLYVSFLLIPGISCLAAAFLKEGVLFTILVLVGKFCISAAFNVTYLYTTELYPTSIRNTATGTCSMIARFGGIAAPWITTYLPDQGHIPDWLPYTILGSLCVLGGSLALLLPDTVGLPLPETFNDIEVMKENSKPFWKLAYGEYSGRTYQELRKRKSNSRQIDL